MITYCVKQNKNTQCLPGSEEIVYPKNGRLMMKCKCAECGITTSRFISTAAVTELHGSGFDQLIVKGLAAGAKGLYNLGKIGASKAIKSDYVRNRIKGIGKTYLRVVQYTRTVTESPAIGILRNKRSGEDSFRGRE